MAELIREGNTKKVTNTKNYVKMRDQREQYKREQGRNNIKKTSETKNKCKVTQGDQKANMRTTKQI